VLPERGKPREPSRKSGKTLFLEDVAQLKGKGACNNTYPYRVVVQDNVVLPG